MTDAKKPWRPHPAVVVHIARLLEIDHMKALVKRRQERENARKEQVANEHRRDS